jgi:hypothetical protein
VSICVKPMHPPSEQIEPMRGVLSKSISVRPSAIVEPVGKPVSVFPVGCCGHAVLDCVGLVSQLYNTLSR